jgi:hypothetical protein
MPAWFFTDADNSVILVFNTMNIQWEFFFFQTIAALCAVFASFAGFHLKNKNKQIKIGI